MNEHEAWLREQASGPMSRSPERIETCNQLTAAANEIKRLRAITSGLPHKDDIETAMRANMMGVEEFDDTNCRCDMSVGQYCEGCAIDSVLRRMRRIVVEQMDA